MCLVVVGDKHMNIHRFHGRRPFNLDDNAIIDFLGIVEGMRILDVGGADGFYAKKIAARGAKVTIIDAREYNFEELNKQGIATILQDFCNGVDLSFDMVFMGHVYHDLVLSCKEKALKNLGRISTKYIANLDFIKEDFGFGPPSSIKLNKSDVVKDMKSIGFDLKRDMDLPYHYLQLFERK